MISALRTALKKIKQGALIEVMDREGLPGDLHDGRSIPGRGDSKGKGPTAGRDSACWRIRKKADVVGAEGQGERVGRNETAGRSRVLFTWDLVGPVRSLRCILSAKEATGLFKEGDDMI